MKKYFKDDKGNCGVFDDQDTKVDWPIITKVEYDTFVFALPVPKKDLKEILLAKGIINQVNFDEVK